ncbi:hypothetical protein Emed_004257 [Eimeria media]
MRHTNFRRQLCCCCCCCCCWGPTQRAAALQQQRRLGWRVWGAGELISSKEYLHASSASRLSFWKDTRLLFTLAGAPLAQQQQQQQQQQQHKRLVSLCGRPGIAAAATRARHCSSSSSSSSSSSESSSRTAANPYRLRQPLKARSEGGSYPLETHQETQQQQQQQLLLQKRCELFLQQRQRFAAELSAGITPTGQSLQLKRRQQKQKQQL